MYLQLELKMTEVDLVRRKIGLGRPVGIIKCSGSYQTLNLGIEGNG